MKIIFFCQKQKNTNKKKLLKKSKFYIFHWKMSEDVAMEDHTEKKHTELFEVKKWNAVALWSYNLKQENCSICHSSIMESCIECQSKANTDEMERISFCFCFLFLFFVFCVLIYKFLAYFFIPFPFFLFLSFTFSFLFSHYTL